MTTGSLNKVIHHLRRAVLVRDGEGMTDGELLEAFLARRDETAFEALVRRHGPMVLNVCRRVVGHVHDAEDAFQAAFLVLARKAASVVPREAVGNWLYGVAYHTALSARAKRTRRHVKEKQVTDMPHPTVAPEDLWPELQPLLDQELNRLPDKYRLPLVLSELEGRTRKEVARQLGVPEGTLSSRLATARKLLAGRLTRRGLAISAGSLALLLSERAAWACVPMSLVVSTVQAAALTAAGQLAAGVVSAQVAALTEGVLKAMLLTKLKVTALVLLVLGGLVLGSGALVSPSLAETAADQPALADELPRTPRAKNNRDTADVKPREPAEQPRRGTSETGMVQSVDAAKNSVTVTVFNRQTGKTEKTYELAKDCVILRDGKPVKLGDLKTGGRVTLQLSADQKSIARISEEGAFLSAPLKSVDAEKRTITVTVEGRQGKQDKTFQVAKDARVMLEGKEAKLTDLKAGTQLHLTASVDDANTIVQIQTSPRRGRGQNEEGPEARNQGQAPPALSSADVPKILDKYRTFRPSDKDLAIYHLDWVPTLKAAKEKAAREQRPILLLVVNNPYGNLYTGHC
jgi:RNA polymerase sigma factor (sigma-70 family)